ncbi:MAG TPA: 16S rRNA (guanine(527)-N(7))-methyltransferase RsmG [Terriglobia bacterium]|nr:16S rRNA (guanine(527)-N(7))-methyltransferase RsmG [Terriglobia bacterium]
MEAAEGGSVGGAVTAEEAAAPSGQAVARLNGLLHQAGLPVLDHVLTNRFGAYLSLLLRWNARINLTAVRDADGIVSRHFFESIACAHALPAGIATLLDLGSGAGFPGIPIGLCRPEIQVTLAESKNRKAAFLHEAIRELGIDARVHACRAEEIAGTFDCITLRAVDRMSEAVRTAAQLAGPGKWIAVMTTGAALASVQDVAGASFQWSEPVTLPGSKDRVVALGVKDGRQA